MTSVLIVDDAEFVQKTFSEYIKNASDKYRLEGMLFSADKADEFCDHVDLILMDICTRRNASGLEATARIKKNHPNIKILIMTSAPEYRFIEKAKAAGADGFWYKGVSEDELIDVMDRIMAGENFYPDVPMEVEVGLALSGEFTRRELEVLLYLAGGESSRSIAEKLDISEDTVKYHTKHLMQKTGCATRTELAVLASKSQIVLPEY